MNIRSRLNNTFTKSTATQRLCGEKRIYPVFQSYINKIAISVRKKLDHNNKHPRNIIIVFVSGLLSYECNTEIEETTLFRHFVEDDVMGIRCDSQNCKYYHECNPLASCHLLSLDVLLISIACWSEGTTSIPYTSSNPT